MKDNISYEEYTFLTKNFRTETGGLDSKKIEKAIKRAKTEKEKEDLKVHLINLLPLIDINHHLFDIYYIIGLIAPFVGNEPIVRYLNTYKPRLSGRFNLEWLAAQPSKDQDLWYADKVYVVFDFLKKFLQEDDHPLRIEAQKFIRKALKTMGTDNYGEPSCYHSFFALLEGLFELNEENPFLKEMLSSYEETFNEGIKRMHSIHGKLYSGSHAYPEYLINYYDKKKKE